MKDRQSETLEMVLLFFIPLSQSYAKSNCYNSVFMREGTHVYTVFYRKMYKYVTIIVLKFVKNTMLVSKAELNILF